MFSSLPVPGFDSVSVLSLDISKSSTGIAVLRDGTLATSSHPLVVDDSSPHVLSLLRSALRDSIISALHLSHISNSNPSGYQPSYSFDVVIVEDVFFGNNPKTFQVLSVLNTVIDDLILEGLITCSDFVRVQSGVWKSWLSALAHDSSSVRSANDKEKVNLLLSQVGISHSGFGYQDRNDASGMVIGYLLNRAGASTTPQKKSGSLPSLSSIEFVYSESLPEGSESAVPFTDRISVSSLRRAVAGAPTSTFVTPKRVSLGVLAQKLGVTPLPLVGGYLLFRLKGQ